MLQITEKNPYPEKFQAFWVKNFVPVLMSMDSVTLVVVTLVLLEIQVFVI